MADATVTPNTCNVAIIPSTGRDFFASAYSANWSTVGEVVAAVAKSTHYLTRIEVRTATACTLTIGSGTGSDAVTTIHLGPVPMDAASGIFVWKAPKGYGLKLTSGTELALETSVEAPLWVYAEGFTAQN